MPKCKVCGGVNFIKDIANANNDTVCQDCGTVSEDNPIVSEVTFGESSSGAAVVHGSYVGAGQSHAAFGPGRGSSALESREATINNARRKLRAVSHALGIQDYVTEAATQWYTLALANNFVQGRRSQNVIAACLYIACRKEKTHHMLIDFSSRLQVSVYSIGATFLKMVKILHITNLPLTDPSLFIQHFAEKLDLGDKKIKVVKDAVKLAQRMARDWMYEGRRPAGIAGACLLLACRMNNLRRTHSEVVAVSHVAEETLQQRLNEFKNTKSGKLSINEFRDDEDAAQGTESQPPSFQRNRVKEKKLRQRIIENEFETSDEALTRNPILSQVLGAQELSSREVLYYLKQFSQRREKSAQRLKATNGIDGTDLYGQDQNAKSTSENSDAGEDENDDLKGNQGPQNASDRPSNDVSRFQDAIDGYSIESDPHRPRNLHLLPTTSSLLSKIADDPEDLQDVDDEELDSQLLDEEASKLKERIWIGINGDFLLEQESNRLKQEADLASGNASAKKRGGPRRKKKPASDADGILADLKDDSGLQAALRLAEDSGDLTTADNVKNMIQKSSFSKKINYNAIDGLFGG
ncbi:LANO_0E00936g1_1 [Lachancea nothofagi CBS 11611]|uniref:Transcription factor IIIB 70 kDa subunit n=1 Tax=Lachancea nothofagi CBS 11611 TaxID=1266666 RepID=A0A1G4JPF2_9SACH|nr:LANO_0E00936g1_1 [Lachancea nothofagi CBS 11611]